ncbi:M56 family metallopeptidase [Pedococcus sp. 5OH_020]|uniref:M56 family metallopeptidase n=1 Tax=Pedococcus sp. 5OH_020 TaxID=2989814 RepID=UPI0022E9D07E|nr:M56 family metallopeptidase [Pedococcus sp. 5OH_020]
MSVVTVVPVLVSAVLGLAASRLVRVLPPATAVRMLTAASLTAALSTGFVLGIVALVAAAQAPFVASLGRWSAQRFAGGGTTSALVGLACGLAMLTLLAAGVRRALRCAADLVAAEAACRRLGPGTHGLVVVEDSHPDAYALPGLAGRVVVSTAMLRALAADERRVLLAHEQAHLRHHHHVYIQLAELAAAANPILRPVATAVRVGTERWADEDAAAQTGDRPLVARTLARASLAKHQSPRSRPEALRAALPSVESAVVTRTRALLAPAPRPRRILAGATAALMLCALGAAAVSAHDTEHRFEVAQKMFHHSRSAPARVAEGS